MASRFRPHPAVLSRQLGDEWVLVQVDDDQVYSLNATAGRFWALLGASGDPAVAERQLHRELEVEREVLAREAAALLGELLRRDLLVPAEDEPAG